jgi:hypothetical protein
VKHSTFTHCTTECTGGGGAIGNFGTLIASNNMFSNNSADGRGGAIYSSGPHAFCSQTNNTFSGNSACPGGLCTRGPPYCKPGQCTVPSDELDVVGC